MFFKISLSKGELTFGRIGFYYNPLGGVEPF
jgi:hypothetical protein